MIKSGEKDRWIGKSAKIDNHRQIEMARKFLDQHSILNIDAVLKSKQG